MSRRRVFVDETKAKGYVLVAGALIPADVTGIRRTVRGLIAPGQNRIHMKSEKKPRQHQILAALNGLDIRATVYRADSVRHRTDIDRRHACLAQLVADVAASCSHLVLESDTSQDRRDRRQLIEVTRATGCHDTLRYEHLTAVVEPLLAIPDAIAWAWARGGEWRERVAPLVDRVVEV